VEDLGTTKYKIICLVRRKKKQALDGRPVRKTWMTELWSLPHMLIAATPCSFGVSSKIGSGLMLFIFNNGRPYDRWWIKMAYGSTLNLALLTS
jgi:hypothetical protein